MKYRWGREYRSMKLSRWLLISVLAVYLLIILFVVGRIFSRLIHAHASVGESRRAGIPAPVVHRPARAGAEEVDQGLLLALARRRPRDAPRSG